jgi:hypothetical protein
MPDNFTVPAGSRKPKGKRPTGTRPGQAPQRLSALRPFFWALGLQELGRFYCFATFRYKHRLGESALRRGSSRGTIVPRLRNLCERGQGNSDYSTSSGIVRVGIVNML